MKLLGDWAPECLDVCALDWDDLCMFNLEGPLLDNASAISPIKKAGPHIFNLTFPKIRGSLICNLANNHIMDYGKRGLMNTLDVLSSEGIRYFGAGENISVAKQPLVINYSGLVCGFLGRAEVQFGVAGDTTSGFAPLDQLLFKEVASLKKNVDKVIVSIHAASEMSPWPSPQRQAYCRNLIEAGADIIWGHHSHVPQGWEVYKGGLIFYGLGNFCVDPKKWIGHRNTLWSLCCDIEFSAEDVKLDISTLTIRTSDDNSLCIEKNKTEKDYQIINYLYNCNKPLRDSILLYSLWQEISVRLFQKFYVEWLNLKEDKNSTGINFLGRLRRFLKDEYFLLKRKLLGQRQDISNSLEKLLLSQVLFSCESHADSISVALGVLTGTIEDSRTPETMILVDQLTTL